MSPDGNVQVIVVPKPAGKVNKDRKINTLLEHQVKRLREIEQRHIPSHQTGLAVDPAKMTEGEAAEFIKRMTTKLRELGVKPKRTRRRKPKVKANPESETKPS
jgi:hypothetical protein